MRFLLGVISNLMDKVTRSSFMHGTEALVAFTLSAVVIYIFKEPLNELLFELIHRPSVVDTIEVGMVGLLGAVFSALAKYARANPNISVTDYVNDEDV